MSIFTHLKSFSKNEVPAVTYGPIHLFFGSQTGTASNFCKILSQEATANNFEPVVEDLIDFEPEKIVMKNLAIFCMATHGEGEPTDNSKEFYGWLSDPERLKESLKSMKFAVFGLGNKQYQFFNAMGKKTNALLEDLGAER